MVVVRILAAFARVGAGAHPVHRDGERGVRLRRERAERHGGRNEAGPDRLRPARPPRAEPASRRARRADRAGRRAGGCRSSRGTHRSASVPFGLDRLLQRHHDRRRPAVVLAFLPEAHAAVVGKRGDRRRRPLPRGYAARWRASTSSAISSNPMPPSGDAVPAKHVSITSWPEAEDLEDLRTAVGADSVEMPIFDRILSRPFSAAARNCPRASAGVGRGAVRPPARAGTAPALQRRAHRWSRAPARGAPPPRRSRSAWRSGGCRTRRPLRPRGRRAPGARCAPGAAVRRRWRAASGSARGSRPRPDR